MKCPKCGYEQAIYDDINEWWHCPQCHGSGEVEVTNEEYIHSLNTEQLAEFISKIDMPFMDKAPFPCGDLIECNKNCGLYSRCVKDDFPTNKEVWVEWLKQPHTPKE